MKNENIIIIVLAVILAIFLLGGFGMMGFGGMMHGGYGSGYLCSNVGGIWCYWPNWIGIFSFIIQVLIVVILILLILWLTKQISNSKKMKGGKK
jgi:protein-S-isoprenylcysteine O-methyltransferase Ste14